LRVGGNRGSDLFAYVGEEKIRLRGKPND